MRVWLRYIILAAFLILPLSKGELAAAADPAKFDMLKLPEFSVTASSYGGKLLLSDSPEMVTGEGVLYQDTIQGDARLFFHHVNDTAIPKKLSVILENNGNEAAQVTVYQYGLGGPGPDYLAVGKQAQLNYLSGGEMYLVEVPANGRAQLSYVLADTVIQSNMLVNGIYDFTSDRPVNVKVMMHSVHSDPFKLARAAKVLPADSQHLRGTFDGRDRMIIPNQVYRAQEAGPVVLTLADNLTDLYVRGIDATDGTPVVNYGNYGVVYKLFLPSDGDGKIGFWLNPRGGDYAGAIGVKYQHKLAPPVPTPENTIAFGINKLTDFAKLGTFEGGQSLWLTFSPPGASNLPVKLLILPEKAK